VAEKQKKSIFKRWWFWVIVAVVVIGIASQGGGDDTPKLSADQDAGVETGADNGAEKETPETPDAEAEEPEFFKLGETVETKVMKVTLTNVEKSEGEEFLAPDEGNEFVLLDITVENISDKDIVVSSILGFNAYVDDTAMNEDYAALTSAKKETMDATVAPGKKMSGTLGYQVPKDWKEIEIHYEPEVWKDIKIKWKIENE